MSGERKDKLSEDTGKVLQSAKPSDYSDAIVKRNLFAPYSPLSPRSDFDLARYTDVTGIVEVDGQGQVWIHNRTDPANKVWKLSAGESFRIGPIQGSVKAFVPPRGPFDQTLVVINLDGRSRLFKQGDNLRGGVAVPEGQQPQ
jgi:hypothetical protein